MYCAQWQTERPNVTGVANNKSTAFNKQLITLNPPVLSQEAKVMEWS